MLNPHHVYPVSWQLAICQADDGIVAATARVPAKAQQDPRPLGSAKLISCRCSISHRHEMRHNAHKLRNISVPRPIADPAAWLARLQSQWLSRPSAGAARGEEAIAGWRRRRECHGGKSWLWDVAPAACKVTTHTYLRIQRMYRCLVAPKSGGDEA